jgi:hypothetical protein
MALIALRRCRPMRRHLSTRPWKPWQTFFAPAPRHIGRQQAWSQPPCRKTSHAARQRRGGRQPATRASCRGPAPVARVRQGRQPPLARGADRPRRARMSKRRAKHPALPTALSTKPLQLVWRTRRSQMPSAGHQRGSLGAAHSAPECRDTMPAPCPPADCPHGGTLVSLGPRMPQEASR